MHYETGNGRANVEASQAVIGGNGGGGRNRTGVDGFAGRCDHLPPRQDGATRREPFNERRAQRCRLSSESGAGKEFELPTSTLARLRSTN